MSVEQDYIKGVDKLVPCPQIALEVVTIANDQDCDLSSIASKVEQDPSLAANMLRLANSAYFGHMRKIDSINEIIVRLGLESVKLIAIASAAVGLLKSSQEAYGLDPGQLNRHSFATAVLASIIGRYAKVPENSVLYTSALLHDVGKIVLNKYLQQAIRDQDIPPEPTEDGVQLEQKLLATDHARVGMLLLQYWGLPDKITLPVGMHHSRNHPDANKLFCRIVYLANHLTESVGIHAVDPSENLFDPGAFRAQEANLPEVPGFSDNMEAIMAEFYEKYNETLATLEIR